MKNQNLISLTLALLLTGVAASAATPTDNPIASHYSGVEGYPAWTDTIHWATTIDMAKYTKGKNDFEKFESARDELSAKGGGVLYYPAGKYDFTTMPADGPNGRGLMLKSGVVIRGEAPKTKSDARTGELELPAHFVFGFQKKGVDETRKFGGDVPRNWNIIGITPATGEELKDVRNVGVCWVRMTGASIYFGGQLKWGATWAAASGWKSKFVNPTWADRVPDGTSPIDPYIGAAASKENFVGIGRGRIVFGCVLEDSAVLNDSFEEGNGPESFHTFKFGARIGVNGARTLVANNVLPISKRNFLYAQTTRKNSVGKGGGSMILGAFEPDTTILFDYGKTPGIEVNKTFASFDSGMLEEGVIVRDNWVFNHGHRGFNVSGNWLTLANNRNERLFLKGGADVYGVGGGWILTLDGNMRSNSGGNGTISDNLARAFDLSGKNLWVEKNWFNNTGSDPGNDGEGILCQTHGGTNLTGWSITHNTHVKGTGAKSYIGSWDVDQHGCLIAWNETSGWVGVINVRNRDEIDCAYVSNKASDVKSKNPATIIECPKENPTAPKNVIATVYEKDAVKITWEDTSANEIGFRVDRSMDEKTWTPIAYRPPFSINPEPDALVWIDFTAPSAKPLRYRVVAIGCEDTDAGASAATEAVKIPLEP